MFLNDYLMRVILQFVAALQKALREQNMTPGQKAAGLEDAVADAVNIDARLLFSMDPESLVSMLQLGDFDEVLGGYVLRCLYLEADVLDDAGHAQRASLRRAQADAIARAYGLEVTAADASPEALEAFLAQQAAGEQAPEE
jgi:hypothetical protein